MRGKPTIQKFVALLVVVLFTISFIPKNYFHDLLADHQDVISCEHPGKEATCIHPKGFNCAFNDLVVSSPYVSTFNGDRLVKPAYRRIYTSSFSQLVLQHFSIGKEGRGPPSQS